VQGEWVNMEIPVIHVKVLLATIVTSSDKHGGKSNEYFEKSNYLQRVWGVLLGWRKGRLGVHE